MINFKRYWPVFIVIVIGIGVVAVYNFWPKTSSLCSDLLELIEEANSEFLTIRLEPSDDHSRQYETFFYLAEADECSISEDAEKASYHCTWRYPLGDAQADNKYELLTAEVRSCIGEIAEEQLDIPVNHPDIYRSSYFQLPKGQLSISQKNKSEFSNTLVTLRINSK